MVLEKTVLITGCSEGGLGDALAQAISKRGCKVIATARSLSKIGHLKELGMEVMELDTTDSKSIAKAVQEVSSLTGGKLDILLNNAGRTYGMPLLDQDPATTRQVFELNVFSYLEVIQAFMPLLIEAKGTVVNQCGVIAYSPAPFSGIYNSSKAAITMLSNTLRLELKPFEVNVVVLSTGAISTQVYAHQAGPGVLPKNSLYAPVRDIVEPILNGSIHKRASSSPSEYAEEVAQKLLQPNGPPDEIWAGGGAWFIWFVITFLGNWVWTLFLPPGNALSDNIWVPPDNGLNALGRKRVLEGQNMKKKDE